MSGSKQRYTAAEVVAACEGTGGIKVLVAKKLSCSRQTVVAYAKRYATVRQAMEDADEARTDVAEGVAGTLVNAGYWPAVKYRLDTKGRKRGYGRQVEGEGGETVYIVKVIGGVNLDEL